MPHEWKAIPVSTLSMYTPAHLHQQLAVSSLYLLCIYMFGVYTERFWFTRRSCNQGLEVNGAGRRNKGVVYGGVPYMGWNELQCHIDSALMLREKRVNLGRIFCLYHDIGSLPPLCSSLLKDIPSKQRSQMYILLRTVILPCSSCRRIFGKQA